MDNATRSQKTRAAVIDAALTIIARDGAGHLTLDAIAQESGLSKGALTHQFRTKKEVLKALLERQMEFFEHFSSCYAKEHAGQYAQPELATQIATLREVGSSPLTFALLAAVAEEPSLMSAPRSADARKLKTIRAEASDPDAAVMRWLAAHGLALTSLLGLCPLDESQKNRLFEQLLDEDRWTLKATPATKSSPSNRRLKTAR